MGDTRAVDFLSKVADLPDARGGLAGTSNGTHAFFAGGLTT